ncbi:MAG: SDR family NAD(P)-dependent oxidoreductase, partial [Actinomycetota bacterium]|nr:SDR family NAD(P)-dependent oxidoreductase [Actinomycetota bacterium]
MRGLEGKRALVTGAGRQRGIGRAIALRLAEEGAHVAVTGYGRDPQTFPEHERSAGWRGVASVADEIEVMGQSSVAFEGDVADPFDVAAMVETTMDALGGIDILVNNAALPSDAGVAPILDMDEGLWFRTVDVNLNGLYLVTRDVGRAMRDQGAGGAIVN